MKRSIFTMDFHYWLWSFQLYNSSISLSFTKLVGRKMPSTSISPGLQVFLVESHIISPWLLSSGLGFLAVSESPWVPPIIGPDRCCNWWIASHWLSESWLSPAIRASRKLSWLRVHLNATIKSIKQTRASTKSATGSILLFLLIVENRGVAVWLRWSGQAFERVVLFFASTIK